MTYLLETITPTRIYHKQCSHCGLNYLGKTTRRNIKSYSGSGKHWTNHLKLHKAKSIHVWNSDWFCDKSIVAYALNLSEELNIVKSEKWANEKPENGLDGGDIGKSGYAKRSITISNPEWKSTIGFEKTTKLKATINDPDWKSTIGAEANIKRSTTQNDSDWKATIGIEKATKYKSTVNDPDYKATKGAEKGTKLSATFNDPTWKNTVGVEKSAKASAKLKVIRNSPEYKKANYKTCDHCGKTTDPGNFSKSHGDKCKAYCISPF